MATTFARAAHLYVDDKPFVFEDRVAVELLPGYLRRYMRRVRRLAPNWLRRYRSRFDGFTAMRAHLVVRARYAEDTLANGDDFTRYIVLGAGFDTFAQRQIEPGIEVIEIDHPATQREKRKLLQQRGFREPEALSFLPIDFATTALSDVWIPSSEADCISWLGVTYYLTAEAFIGTLTTLAECVASGSELVMDYWEMPPPLDRNAPLMLGTRLSVALQQEPMHSFFSPIEVETIATGCGWKVAENLTPDEQNKRYLADRKDGLAVPSFAHLLRLVKE